MYFFNICIDPNINIKTLHSSFSGIFTLTYSYNIFIGQIKTIRIKSK